MTETNECETIIKRALKEGRSSLLIHEAERVCELHRIPTPKSGLATNAEEAVNEAREIGFPVVMKIVSPQILHKSEVGGVIQDVRNEKEVRAEYDKLIARVRSREHTAEVLGVLVQRMMPPSTELIVGGIRDKQFGPAVMFGIGGILAEVYDDVAFRVAPIDAVDALNLVRGLRGSKILSGFRGKLPADVDSIVGALISISSLMTEHDTVEQLDLNPVIAYSDGLCAVDCRIIIRPEGGGV
jgi:succinyl-CoA synthetase beta subunit